MKGIKYLGLAFLLVVGLSASAFAHTGPLGTDGQPIATEIDFSSVAAIDTTHDETLYNPLNAYKGWWFINLTNSTTASWAGVTIAAGEGDSVALVEGNNLPDEWGFTANSVVANRVATYNYVGDLGSQTYSNGSVGLLHNSVTINFADYVATSGKVAFKVYTDNSYYSATPATSFSVKITPFAAPVPEPSGILVLISGAATLVGFARRKR